MGKALVKGHRAVGSAVTEQIREDEKRTLHLAKKDPSHQYKPGSAARLCSLDGAVLG